MLDMYTSNGNFAFQLDELEDLADSWEDYGIEDDVDLNELGGPSESALVVLVPSGKGGWHYSKVIGANDLERALGMAGLLPQE